MKSLLAAALLVPAVAWADGLTITEAKVPLAPPTAMAHAAYMSLVNDTGRAQQIIGVRAEGYGMAHLHRSEIANDIATMSALDVIEIGPGQTITLDHGGLHIMLMRPDAPKAEGDTVAISFEFADGSVQTIDARVIRLRHGM